MNGQKMADVVRELLENRFGSDKERKDGAAKETWTWRRMGIWIIDGRRYFDHCQHAATEKAKKEDWNVRCGSFTIDDDPEDVNEAISPFGI
jgi:hypothetical protein